MTTRPSPLLRAVLAAALTLGLFACSEAPTPPALTCDPGYQPAADGKSCEKAPASCKADAPGSILAACAAQGRQCFEDAQGALCGVCQPGHVSAQADGACRAVKTCSELACDAQGRSCLSEGSATDARCGACLAGAEQNGTCVKHTCAPAPAAGSILDDCTTARRACDEGSDEASCGGCWPQYVEEAGRCRPVRTCLGLACAAGHRGCTAQTATSDAACTACRAGYEERGGDCIAREATTCDALSTPQSILAACEGEHRTCAAGTEGAACGDCETGYVEDPATGACRLPEPCSALSCASEHRACEAAPTAHCTTCLPGFLPDPTTGSCRAVKTCGQLSCAAGEQCAAETDSSDAFCRTDCGPSAIWGGSRCEPCPPCDDVGEDGRWPLPTAAGSCMCKTKPGFFYSVAGDVGSFRCDADGDGWVRESARLPLESTDAALRTNARCELRTIDRFQLVNEAGSGSEVMLSAPLPLYETDRNDDAAVLEAAWRQRGLPAYGTNGRRVEPAEINRLTKLCHDPRTDYNDNGVADVEDWSGHALGPAMRSDQRAFNEFSYFAELHTGAYEPGPAGSPYGRFVIREKSRLGTTVPTTHKVPVGYPALDGTYWQQCDVDRDPRFGTQQPPVGLDFARLYDPAQAWAGMNHHSQFKCVVIDNEPSPANPLELTPAQVAARGYRLNHCQATAAPVKQAGNPAESSIECALEDASQARPGDVRWAAVPYQDYGPQKAGSSYQGGCVNACIAALPTCPSYDLNPVAVSCTHDAADSGKFLRCNVREVCDGLDNDFINGVDDHDPEGGQACPTHEPGVCAVGTTHCRSGVLKCERDVQPSAEKCNGLDDNCNGTAQDPGIDEGNPGGNVACTVPGKLGECAKGTRNCRGGALVCDQTKQPAVQETCNGLDDDCDGAVDEGPEVGEPAALGCTDFYLDADNDGFGASAASKMCLCRADTVNHYTAVSRSAGFDCCDRAANTYPGSPTGYQTSANACGSFDYNCNGLEDKALNTSSSGGCGKCCTWDTCCCDAEPGWANGVAGCGVTASYYSDSCGGWMEGCDTDTYSRTQSCR